jgi:hypothetical protein
MERRFVLEDQGVVEVEEHGSDRHRPIMT